MATALYVLSDAPSIRAALRKSLYEPSTPATMPDSVLGDTRDIELYIITKSGTYDPRSGSADVAPLLALARTSKAPTVGTYTLTYGADTTSALAYNATAAEVETALNALASIIVAGGVDLTGGTGGPFTVIFRSVGAQTLITGSSLDLLPSSGISINQVTAGDGSTAEIQSIRIQTRVVALTDTWTQILDVDLVTPIGWAGTINTNNVGVLEMLETYTEVDGFVEIEITESGKKTTLCQQAAKVRYDIINDAATAPLVTLQFATLAALDSHVASTGNVHGAVSTATASQIVTRDSEAASAFGGLDLDTVTIASAYKQGRLRWNDTEKCVEIDIDASVTTQVGRELIVRARNSTGSTIANGTPVYVSGATGNRPTISPADASAFASSETMIGLVTNDAGIANNADGFIAVFGIVHDLDTSSFSDGDQLYLSDSAPGILTATKPTASTSFIVEVGVVTLSHATQGQILVHPYYRGSTLGDSLANATSTAGALAVIGAQSIEEIVTGATQPAVAGARYVNTATTTYTDPVSPADGESYQVRVSSGTATVNSVAYSVAGTVIVRAYEGAALVTHVYQDQAAYASAAQGALADTAMQLDPIVTDYRDRVIAAGSSVETADLVVLDSFIRRGRRVGWFSSIVEFCPFLGENLAAALIKVISSTGELVNNGVLEAEYSTSAGITISSQATKWLSTGFIPSSNGLSVTDLTMTCFSVTAFPLVNSGYIVGTNPASGDNILFFNGGAIGFTGYSSGAFIRRKAVSTVTSNAGALSIYLNGTKIRQSTSTPTAGVDTELTIFKSTRNAVARYEVGNISCLLVSTALSDTLSKDVNLAVMELYRACGRYPSDRPYVVTIGDSIGAGQGTTPQSERPDLSWSVIASSVFGGIELNHAQPSAQLRQDAGSGAQVAIYTRYTDSISVEPSTIMIMAGTNDMNVADVTTDGDSTIIADYQSKLTTILSASKSAGIRTICVSPPYNTVSNATKISAYVTACAAAAVASAVPFVDAYTPIADKTIPGDYMTDVIHPNNAGHALIASAVIRGRNGDLFRELSIDPPSIAANTTSVITVTVYGARAGQQVLVTPPAALNAGLIVKPAYVSANDTVSIPVHNLTGSAIDDTAATWAISVKTGL